MLRIAAAPFFACAFLFGLKSVSCVIFLLATCTDFADGFAARKLGVASDFGAYYDATADMIFIAAGFGAFFAVGYYPFWIFLVIVTVYTQFMITSLTTELKYDPLGKYYGSLLYGAIGLTLLFPVRLFFNIVVVSVVGVTAASLVSRTAYFLWSRDHRHL